MARTPLSAAPNAISLPSGDQLPPYTVSKVTGWDNSSFCLRYIPDLNLAHAAGQTARNRQPRAVRREPHGFNPLGHADQTAQFAPSRPP